MKASQPLFQMMFRIDRYQVISFLCTFLKKWRMWSFRSSALLRER